MCGRRQLKYIHMQRSAYRSQPSPSHTRLQTGHSIFTEFIPDAVNASDYASVNFKLMNDNEQRTHKPLTQSIFHNLIHNRIHGIVTINLHMQRDIILHSINESLLRTEIKAITTHIKNDKVPI
jgi:hypothetical protein